MRYLKHLAAPFLALLASHLLTTAVEAISYSGRFVDETGKPVPGPTDIRVRFFTSDMTPTPLPVTVPTFEDVALKDGVFQITIPLSGGEASTLFGQGSNVFIEISDLSRNKIYPRQKFAAVPYALSIPVDGDAFTFDDDGKLAFATEPVEGTFLRIVGGQVSWQTPGGGGDMSAATYDATGTPGVVDDSEELGGEPGSFYRNASNINAGTLADAYIPAGIARVAALTSSARAALTASGPITYNGTSGTIGLDGTKVSNWDAAHTDRLKWDGSDTGLNAATARASLQLDDVQNVNVLETFIQGDGERVETEQVRARDGEGLSLFNAAGSGLFVDNSGNVAIGSTTNPSSNRFSVFDTTDSQMPIIFKNLSTGTAAAAKFSVESDAGGLLLQTFGSAYAAGGLAGYARIRSENQLSGLILEAGGIKPLSLRTNNADRVTVDGTGNVGIGTTSPSRKLDVADNGMRIRSARTPSSASDACQQGEIAWDSNYIYVCVITDSWKRTSLTNW